MNHYRSYLFSAIAAAILCLFPNSAQSQLRQDKDSLRHKAQVEAALSKMSVRQKVAQLFIVELSRNPSPATRAYQDSLVGYYGLGNVILMEGSIKHFLQRMDELQAIAQIPIMVAVDGEWGAAMRFPEYLPYPRQAQLSRIEKNGEKLLYKMGRNVGKELKDINVMVNYAPVADVSKHYMETGALRTLSDDPRQVSLWMTAYMKGMQDAGIYACGKHYPGHGGTTVDSHFALPVIMNSKAYMDTVDLYPFKNLIDNGVEMMMLAHISVPAIDPSGVPMSISPILINDVLRGEQGFKGVVITDAIAMAGLTNESRTPVEAVMAVYKAGSDMLLMPDEPIKCIEALTKAVESGELPMEELDNKVRKVLMLKARVGYLEDGYSSKVKNLDHKIAAARRRDFRLIKKMRRLMKQSTKPHADLKPRGQDVTLIFDKAGK
jgi:beta-glucosidase-like glycosyl hydrolase